ncbi:MAG: hypothetical protein NWF00_04935 [Candidatus Bathyarchaeota archaeon]|nr:hypothetical protein [Candidatus Bathyarchaeota archaeon]
MTKGKPWPAEKEKQLRELVEAKTSLPAMAKVLRKSEEAVRQKIGRLGLEVVEQKKIVCSTTSKEFMPAELPSVEEMLRKMVAAVNALETSALDKSEVLRLRGIITGVKVYQELLAEYLDYRGLEAELLNLRAKYGELRQKYDALVKKSKDDASR